MKEKIILASKSPRRLELMKLLPVSFSVVTKETEEVLDPNLSPEKNVSILATLKAEAVASEYLEHYVIGCDTIVAYDGQLLGKPKSLEDAREMLTMLSGKSHDVLTGVTILCKDQNLKVSFVERTVVSFVELTDKEITYYIETGEPFDKAGGYGIQGYGAPFIKGIEGDYYNVMGLPLSALYKQFKSLNLI